MRNKYVDFLLVLVILGSISVIGFRIFEREAGLRSVSIPVPEQSLVNSEIRTGPILTTNHGFRGQTAFAQQSKLDLSAWNAAVAKARLTPVEESTKCRMPGGGKAEDVYQVLDMNLRDTLVSNGGGVVPRYGVRKCHRKGQTLSLQYYGFMPEEPYISAVGDYKVVEILEFDRDQVSNSFWKALNTTREDNPSLIHNSKVMLLLIEKKTDVGVASMEIPTTHFRYNYLTEADIQTTPDLKKSSIVLDLRNATSREKVPIAHARVVEFKTQGGPIGSNDFRWDVKISDLEKSEIALGPVYNLEKSDPVFVIGENESDGRPFWLLRSLSNVGFEKVYWYNGSAAPFEAARR